MKRSISVLLCVLFLFSIVACSSDYYNVKQTDYHDEVAYIEKLVLEEYGDYVKFSALEIDNSDSSPVIWELIFLRSYIWDDQKTSELSPYQVAEDIREIINSNLDQWNSLSENRVKIELIRPKQHRHSTAEANDCIGSICNYSLLSSEKYAGFLCVDYQDYDHLSDYIGDKADVSEITMADCDVQTVLDVVDTLPDIEIVYVNVFDSDPEVTDQLTELRPEIRFI